MQQGPVSCSTIPAIRSSNIVIGIILYRNIMGTRALCLYPAPYITLGRHAGRLHRAEHLDRARTPSRHAMSSCHTHTRGVTFSNANTHTHDVVTTQRFAFESLQMPTRRYYRGQAVLIARGGGAARRGGLIAWSFRTTNANSFEQASIRIVNCNNYCR